MKSDEIRRRFLAFFEKRGHKVIESASLVTSDEKGITNPTLFNTAGMQPLIPYLLGKTHPLGKRLADVQKCLRTVDIDDVGDATHATFFEMLGNWSLGDYFKKEAIRWSYEFLTNKEEGLGLDASRLYVTVFAGDDNAPRDNEAAKIWSDIFKENNIDAGGDTDRGEKGRIFYMPAENNWWQAGDNGPCGPDSEMFFDVSGKLGGRTITRDEYMDADAKRDIVEVWNDVFMQYEKTVGKIVGTLPAPSVDTGAGLERLTMVMQGVNNIYDTDLLKPVFEFIKSKSNKYDERSARIIADHIRASVFLISDGVIPSNTDRGYVLRKLLRRAIRARRNLDLQIVDLSKLAYEFDKIYRDAYPRIHGSLDNIIEIIRNETGKFTQLLHSGDMEVARIIKRAKTEKRAISGAEAFMLYSSFGFPIEETKRIASIDQVDVDVDQFEGEMKAHQARLNS
ncbi:MAG: alanine--tRNA ligase-related protein, partial [Patescibacteria group bacterium]|nr:alanine--tRNA ligase-related protein [Patescibacteria group bacterium]